MRLVDRLNRSPVTHALIERLHVRGIANRALGVVPIVRTLPSGVKYRYSFLDSIPLADEIFGQKVYDRALSSDIRTFVDLGCNVGQFVARLADFTGRRDLRGLAVDADRDMIRETAWVVRANGLDGVTPVLGLVGANGSGGVGEFHLHSVKIKSSRFAVEEPGRKSKGDWTTTHVPYVDVEMLWRGLLGDARCDLLKVDIEGSEADFVTPANPFLKRVDRIVIETHKWIVPAAEITARLGACGFRRESVLEETDALEVACFVR
jgi:FkbM family methyltransferase